MCFLTGGDNKRPVSVHAIERFVQWRLRIPKESLSIFTFFQSPEHIEPIGIKLKASAQENYFREMLEQERFGEVLIAFDRFYRENRILCLSTVAMIIFGLFHSSETVLLPEEAELFLKSSCTDNPRRELDVRYYRFQNIIFIVSEKIIITCFSLTPYQKDVLNSMFSKTLMTTDN